MLSAVPSFQAAPCHSTSSAVIICQAVFADQCIRRLTITGTVPATNANGNGGSSISDCQTAVIVRSAHINTAMLTACQMALLLLRVYLLRHHQCCCSIAILQLCQDTTTRDSLLLKSFSLFPLQSCFYCLFIFLHCLLLELIIQQCCKLNKRCFLGLLGGPAAAATSAVLAQRPVALSADCS